jgi:hypothetical protein
VSQKPEMPPGVFVNDQFEPAGVNEAPIKPDWKDFVALTVAAYQVVLPPLLMILAGILLVFFLMTLLFH